MPLDPDDSRPPFLQIAAALRQAIGHGEFKPGDLLPSTANLTREYGVSAMTARSAVRVLVDDGLVVARHGQGTFVRTDIDPAAATPVNLVDVRSQLADLDERVRVLTERVTVLEDDRGSQD
jgi:DNA-binding GntR family transcriptional regulator